MDIDISKYNLKGCHTQEKFIQTNYPELYEYMINDLPNDLSWGERLYWIKNDIHSRPTCPVCGKEVNFCDHNGRYYNYCSVKCMSNSKEVRSKIEHTCIDKYGLKYPLHTEETREEIRKKYGGIGFASKIVMDKFLKVCEERYGNPHYSNREKAKETVKKTYNSSRGKEITDHIYQVKKKNQTLNSSKIEDDIENWLKENDIIYERHHKNKKYPFACDFYFPPNDLYLEIQGHWTHGKHPFNPENEEDQSIVESWKIKNTKYYNSAIDVWTVRDVNKREYAKNNNLNFHELFQPTLDDVINFVHKYVTE